MSEITAWDYYTQQQALQAAAAEKYPWDPQTCTHHLGVERQLLYACRTCRARTGRALAVCYSCSIQCHADHDLIELYTRRGLTCDCGTVQGAGERCRLRGTAELEPTDNAEYNHNFDGRFCACDIEYTEHEPSTMLQCYLGSVCQEDWFHERCVLGLTVAEEEALRAEAGLDGNAGSPAPAQRIYESGVNMLDTLESALDVPMPPTSELEAGAPGTVAAVAASAEFGRGRDALLAAARAPSATAAQVVARLGEAVAGVKTEAPEDASREIKQEAAAGRGPKDEADDAEEQEAAGKKAEADQPKAESDVKIEDGAEDGGDDSDGGDGSDEEEDGSDAEDTLPGLPNSGEFEAFVCWRCVAHHDLHSLLDDDRIVAAAVLRKESAEAPADGGAAPPAKKRRAEAYSLFLREGFRERFAELAGETPAGEAPAAAAAGGAARVRALVSKFPYLTRLEHTYEPPWDPDATSSLASAGERALRSLPHEQAVSGIQAYKMMRDKLTRFLGTFAQSGKVVTKEDVGTFFDQLKSDTKREDEAE